MHAIVVESADRLTWQEVPDITPAAGEVVVDISAAGVNRADLLQAAGKYPPPPGASEVLGLEVSGTIAEVGEHVDKWSIGQSDDGHGSGPGAPPSPPHQQSIAVVQGRFHRRTADDDNPESSSGPAIDHGTTVTATLRTDYLAGFVGSMAPWPHGSPPFSSCQRPHRVAAQRPNGCRPNPSRRICQLSHPSPGRNVASVRPATTIRPEGFL